MSAKNVALSRFSLVFSPLPPQTRQFGKCDFAGRSGGRNCCVSELCSQICDISTERFIQLKKKKTLALSVDFPRIPALSSHRSHSGLKDDVWKTFGRKKKRLFREKKKCVGAVSFLFLFTGEQFSGFMLYFCRCVCKQVCAETSIVTL